MLKICHTFAASKEKTGDGSPLICYFMIDFNTIKNLISNSLDKGEFLVDIKINKANQIKVFVDGDDNFNITNCQRISRAIESGLDREKEDFELVVSTPGLDTGFKVKEQFKKYTGKKVDLELDTGEKFTADILETGEQGITIRYKKNKKDIQEDLKYEEISKAKPHISF